MISSAVGALLSHVTAKGSHFLQGSRHIVIVVACPMITYSVATLGLAATLVLHVTLTTAECTSGGSNRICIRFDTVLHLHQVVAGLYPQLCHLALGSNDDYQ